jgi:superfamily II DNA helicase RecQ
LDNFNIDLKKNFNKFLEVFNKIKNGCCEAYHAGLSKKSRENIHKKFTDGDIKIIISTIAFGMGIDQIVKCVLIFGSPSSVEEYYQQIGRGGRDGLPCETVLYFDYSKFKIAQFMLKDFIKYPTLYKVKKDNLNKVKNLVYLKTCRRRYILEYFNEKCNFINCNNCDNCCNYSKKIIEQQPNIIKKDSFEDIINKYEKYL